MRLDSLPAASGRMTIHSCFGAILRDVVVMKRFVSEELSNDGRKSMLARLEHQARL